MTRIGIVTVSDRASRGEYVDRGGPAILDYLRDVLVSDWTPVSRMVSDEREQIEAVLIELADREQCALIITTGGTGPAPRDVTPEATAAVCERILPGFGEEMRRASLQFVPTAILSRQIAGSRGTTLMINLPGSPKAIAQCLDAIFAAVPYCVDLLGGPRIETNPDRIVAFRPQQK
jgi:molybdopterin adenylyltransferase